MNQTVFSSNVCYKHPNRETMLRCKQCDRYICPSCAVRTPTGYLCKECVRGHQRIFNTADPIDYPIAFFLSAILSFLASLIAGVIGYWGLFLAPVAGGAIAEAVRWAIRRHRAPALYYTAAAGSICGVLPSLLFNLVMGNYYGMIWPGAYLLLVTPIVYYRLRGIRIG